MTRQQIEQRPAFTFMMDAHNSIGQKRKYTGEPYGNHPLAVTVLLVEHYPFVTPEMIDAALLHDVPEDVGNPDANPNHWQNYTIDAVTDRFGPVTGLYVDGLTERTYPGLNRAKRKALEAERLWHTCNQVHTIKLCDMLDNTADIMKNDPGFAKTYMQEKRHLLLHGLRNGYPPLWNLCNDRVENYFKH